MFGLKNGFFNAVNRRNTEKTEVTVTEMTIFQPFLNKERFPDAPVSVDSDGKFRTFLVSDRIVFQVLKQFLVG